MTHRIVAITIFLVASWSANAADSGKTAAEKSTTSSAASAPKPPAPPAKEPPPPPATQFPPPPPQRQPIEPPAPPPAATPVVPAPPLPSGQWVYTTQYGWLWMPHDAGYTHVVPEAALAYAFVYYPTFGWRWVVAPWVLGFGAAPYWGTLGPTPFGWYRQPRFRLPAPYHGRGWIRPVVPRSPLGRGHHRP